MAKLRKILL